MVKKALAGALLVAFLMTGIASGQSISALPDQGWWTSAGIQNVGTGTATVDLTAYPIDPASTQTYAVQTTIVQDGSVTFLPGSTAPGTVDVSPSLPTGFAGSMVIASDQPLVAIGQVGNNQLTNPPLGREGGYASGMYRGADAGAATITFPTVKSNFGGKTSTFYVQATGADVTAVATVKTNDGVSHTANYTIKANKSVVVNTGDFSPAIATTSCGAANTSPCLGALSITATGGDIAGVAIEADTTASPATRAQVASMFSASDAATAIYCPVFKNDFGGRYTGVTVQNVSGGTANLYASFTASVGGSGTYRSTISNVADGTSQTFTAQLGNVGGFPSNAYGSMVITSTGNIIAAVNEANFSGTALKATTYTCFAASNATTKVAFPQVKESFGVNTTGVSVQNVGGNSTTINATYTCDGVSYAHTGVSLAKGATYTYYKPSSSAANWSGTALPSNKLCAVVVTAGEPLVGVGQEAATTNLDTKNYEAFNLTP
jgi:hypothetical protein